MNNFIRITNTQYFLPRIAQDICSTRSLFRPHETVPTFVFFCFAPNVATLTVGAVLDVRDPEAGVLDGRLLSALELEAISHVAQDEWGRGC